jgi:hypothetical protein
MSDVRPGVRALQTFIAPVASRRAVNVVAILHLEQSRFQPAMVCKARVLLMRPPPCGSSASRYSGFRSPARPPGSFNGPEGGKSLFSFNRTSGGLIGAANRRAG